MYRKRAIVHLVVTGVPTYDDAKRLAGEWLFDQVADLHPRWAKPKIGYSEARFPEPLLSRRKGIKRDTPIEFRISLSIEYTPGMPEHIGIPLWLEPLSERNGNGIAFHSFGSTESVAAE